MSAAEETLDLAPSLVHPSELHESPDNPRQITDERFDALCYALERSPDMMIPRPIIAMPDGEVIAGNMRRRAAGHMLEDPKRWPNFNAWVEKHGGIPVHMRALSPAERREWMLRDNQGYGEWETDELARMLVEHRDDGADMALLGFEDAQMEAIIKQATGDGTGGGDGPEPDPPMDVWGVVVECANETDQTQLLEELEERGFTVRALL